MDSQTDHCITPPAKFVSRSIKETDQEEWLTRAKSPSSKPSRQPCYLDKVPCTDLMDDWSDEDSETPELKKLQSESVIQNLDISITQGWNILDKEASIDNSSKKEQTKMTVTTSLAALEKYQRQSYDSCRERFLKTLICKKRMPQVGWKPTTSTGTPD